MNPALDAGGHRPAPLLPSSRHCCE